ncbi:hypothetical protein BLX88_02930, partial [Bacillus obstructivus]
NQYSPSSSIRCVLIFIFFSRKLLTPTVKDTIKKLAFLYSINEVEMQKIILSSMTADETIDLDELKKKKQMKKTNEVTKII